jgi:hypothetical protein
MHIMDASYANAQSRVVHRMLPKKLREFIQSGTAPHDTWAPPAFVRFLPKITTGDPVWSERATWLVDTGDLTSFGDDDSLRQGHNWLARFVTAAWPVGVKFLYGNHDAWPAKFPLFARYAEIERHRGHLRATWYPATWPDPPLRERIPGTGSEVQLWCLNSVLHERRWNWRAFGEVRSDRYWEPGAAGAGGDAVAELAREVGKDHKAMGARHLRILAVHHPVHYPPPRPSRSMSMRNDAAVAQLLYRHGGPEHTPLAHLVLSGHTHGLYPASGVLPNSARACAHYPLGDDQCQLVAGSLTQLDRTGSRFPHQCELLRFYASSHQPNDVKVERLVAARANGLGEFGFVAVGTKDGKRVLAEEILLSF